MNEIIGYTVVSIYRLKGKDHDTIDLVGGVHPERIHAENHRAVCEGHVAAGKIHNAGQRYEVVRLVKVEGE